LFLFFHTTFKFLVKWLQWELALTENEVVFRI
jgi:hypothetical protein